MTIDYWLSFTDLGSVQNHEVRIGSWLWCVCSITWVKPQSQIKDSHLSGCQVVYYNIWLVLPWLECNLFLICFSFKCCWKEQEIYCHCAKRYHIQIVSFCLNKQNISFNNSFGFNRRKRATAHHLLENFIHKWFISLFAS